MPRAATVRWTREHLLIALNLYCKLPFGSFDHRNRILVEVAAKMGRSTNSLAMKLCNFASLDPVQRARGIKGLEGASRQDQAMWDEFQAQFAVLGPQSEQRLHDLFTADEEQEVDFLQRDRVRLEPTPREFAASPSPLAGEGSGVRGASSPSPLVGEGRGGGAGPTEAAATVLVRRGQQLFRQSILNAYGVKCCISGIGVPQLLVASHIRPWGDFPADRLNPRNGLCLSRLHDAAFDCGHRISPSPLVGEGWGGGDFRVLLSKRLTDHFPHPALERNFAPYAGLPITLPEKLAEPDPAFLAYHREAIFQG